MASLNKIIKRDKHPLWLVDAMILSAVVYSKDPQEELDTMNKEYGLPPSAQYQFVSEEELNASGFENCRQTLLVVRNLTDGHLTVAFRGTFDFGDALTDLNFIHREMSLGPGAAHSGFLDRARSLPLEYFRRLLIRGENIVLTGHSLGGAVASLLTLRLLEATAPWCHEQVQCYTFGCPFFADYTLAKYINSHYEHHFIHIVSENDIVPKVMPLAYTIYTMFAGLQVGPLQDLIHLSNIIMLVAQLLAKVQPERVKFTKKMKIVSAGTQALAWFPGIFRFILHRALALVLSYHSGYGYAFAGKMILLNPAKSGLEYVEQDSWTVRHHLSFHLGSLSLDVMKGHSLFVYIDHVFAVQAVETSNATLNNKSNAKVDVCSTILQWKKKKSAAQICSADGEGCNDKQNRASIKHEQELVKSKTTLKRQNHVFAKRDQLPRQASGSGFNKGSWKRKPAIRHFRSKVACLIFAKRIQEASPNSIKHRNKRRAFVRFCIATIGRLSAFAHKFDALVFASSAVFVGMQIHKLFY